MDITNVFIEHMADEKERIEIIDVFHNIDQDVLTLIEMMGQDIQATGDYYTLTIN